MNAKTLYLIHSILGDVRLAKYETSSEEGAWRGGSAGEGGIGVVDIGGWMDGSGLTPLMKPRAWSNSERSLVSSIASGR